MDMPCVTSVDTGWSTFEFADVDLGDRRLNKRLHCLLEDFGAQPAAPINQACRDWNAVKAAYAFFANPDTHAADILLPHQACTLERMAAHPLVLAVQDTCFLNYTAHPATAGMGPIGGGQRGLVMHSTLAFTPQGLPLGVLDQRIWARPDVDPAAPKPKQRPIGEKESVKWLDALRETVSMTPSEIRLITIADRESDIFEFLTEAAELDSEYVIRAEHNREITGELTRLWPYMATRPRAGTVMVTLAARPGHPKRTAILTVRMSQSTLDPPVRPATDPGIWMVPLTVWAIWLHEETPPTHVTPVDWMLLTNVPALTWQDALERIGWYCVRPEIESWHKVLKSGCTIEACRLESVDRLIPYLTLMGVIAWRLFWLTYIGRHDPDAPCTLILAEHEWKALYLYIHHTTHLPDTIPTVRQAIHWIGRLGGFLDRKGDGEPGITAIWRGWSRLADMANMYLILPPPENTGNS